MNRNYQTRLRDRIIARRNVQPQPTPLDLPLNGVIAADVVVRIQQLAQAAKGGDVPARDLLYASMQPRLHRMGYVVRPWPNSPDFTGVWDRDDVNQEGWIIFVELLDVWNGDLPFVAYLFARFPWRLRDRILRGIGKPLPPIGSIRIPENILADVLSASDSDQPESALMASKLLDHLLQRRLVGHGSPANLRTVLTALRSPATPGDLEIPDDDHPFSQIEVA